MKAFEIVLWVFLGIYIIFWLCLFARVKNKGKYLLFSSLISLALLAVINLTGFATGLKIPINECTVIGTLIGNVPAIGGFLLLRYIFIL